MELEIHVITNKSTIWLSYYVKASQKTQGPHTSPCCLGPAAGTILVLTHQYQVLGRILSVLFLLS